MTFTFDERQSDSPFVAKIWRTTSGPAGTFISQAASYWEMVITRQRDEKRDQISMVVRGPETQASVAPIPAYAEFIGIQFQLGAFMPRFPVSQLVDHAVPLPEAAAPGQAVWMDSSVWQMPSFDNADVFVDRLVRAGLLVRDPVVEAALRDPRAGVPDELRDLSLRTVQRRFLRATGLTLSAIHQIRRAEQAAALLSQGVSIQDTVGLVGYADQPHLTRSLKRLVGQTPAQVAAAAVESTVDATEERAG